MKPLDGRTRFLAFRWIGILAALALLLPATSSAQPLDLTKPDDIVKANRKIQSSLVDGKPTIIYFEGNVYSRVAGEKDRLLFTYQGIQHPCHQARWSRRVAATAIAMVSRELLVYLDPKTKEVLRTWKNPWTGEEVEVVHVANDPVNWPGRRSPRVPRGPAKWTGDLHRRLVRQGFEVPLSLRKPPGRRLPGVRRRRLPRHRDLLRSIFRKDEVIAADTTEAPIDVGWARVCQWLPWMKMGGPSRLGDLQRALAGAWRAGTACPRRCVKEIEANYPEYKEPPPLDDARPNETSWTYFKKWIDAKRAKEPTKEKEKE